METKNKKRTIIAAVVLAVLVIGALCAWFFYFKPKTEAAAGIKHITIQVTHIDKAAHKDQTFSVKTKEEFLLGAARSVVKVEGDPSEYGLYVKTVDGETADDSKQQWWCIMVNGEMGALGIESQPVAEGDKFELILQEGWPTS
ncbi:MAG: DUF4430 domain-containing protein [Lachnospiraceae bacterium]|nr:DUF4430 domain-containing protein [Lachnospiraceae bacterium]